MPAIIDSYSEANWSNTADIGMANGSGLATGVGQAFIAGSNNTLGSSVGYLYKTGTVSGPIVSKIYNQTGTYGSNAVPTGSPLATSSVYDASALTTSPQLIQFYFTGANAITMLAGNHYVVTFEYSGGDASNCRIMSSWVLMVPARRTPVIRVETIVVGYPFRTTPYFTSMPLPQPHQITCSFSKNGTLKHKRK